MLKKKFKYVVSLGEKCHTASFLKRNNLKKESYPFDWIHSSADIIIHCLEDNFNTFLNKEYYTFPYLEYKFQYHSFYYPNNNLFMFNHHNPLNENDYNYYIRCIERFNNVLKSNENKLFIKMYVNNSNKISFYKN